MPDEYRLIGSEHLLQVLEHQVQIYQDLLRRSQTLLRLVIGTSGLLVALVSAAVTSGLELTLPLERPSGSLEQAVSDYPQITVFEGEIIIILLCLIGAILAVGGVCLALSGILEAFNASSNNTLEPYLPNDRVDFTVTSGESQEVMRNYVNQNADILHYMKKSINKAYWHLTLSVISLMFGIFLFGAGYLALFQSAAILTLISTAALPLFALPLILQRKFGPLSRTTSETIDAATERFDQTGRYIFALLVFLFIWLPLVYVFFLILGGVATVGVIVFSVIIPASIFLYDSRRNRGPA